MAHLDLELGGPDHDTVLSANDTSRPAAVEYQEKPLPYPMDPTPIPSIRSQPSLVIPSLAASIPGLPPYPIDETIGIPLVGAFKPATKETPFDLEVIMEEPPPFVPPSKLQLTEPSHRLSSENKLTSQNIQPFCSEMGNILRQR
jgi:hypothetical protein